MKLRSLVSTLAITLCLLAGAFGQSVPTSLVYSVNLYANWHGVVLVGNNATGSQTIVITTAGIPIPGRGLPRNPLTGAGFVPIQVDQETEIPTAITCGVNAPTGANVPSSAMVCNVTATWTSIHGNNSPVSSGDAGVQEALNDACSTGGDVVADGTSGLGSGNTFITQATPCSSAIIEDHRTGTAVYWSVRPTTQTTISAGSAPVAAVGTGGALTAGAYLLSYVYVDAAGGLSLAATDSSTTTTTTGNQTITVTAPAATAGAVGYIPYITAASGSAGSEIAVPLTGSVCTLTTLESVIPACSLASGTQLSSNAVITANPSATSIEPVFATAHTALAFQPFNNVPLAFQTVYGPFTAVATISAAANSDVAQFYIPAGYFNTLTKSLDICLKSNYSVTSTGIPTFTLKAANNYGQSPVTLSTIVLPTQAAAVTTDGCFTVSVAATGASGTFWTGGSLVQTLNSTGVASVAGEVTTAVSSAVDLTKGIYFSVNIAATTASVTAAKVNSLWIKPVTAN